MTVDEIQMENVRLFLVAMLTVSYLFIMGGVAVKVGEAFGGPDGVHPAPCADQCESD